jgi:hypothetical protein
MVPRQDRPLQTWKTFLRNHMEGIASIDLFVVPTIAFEQLFAFLVLGHERRQLLWFAVTRNPTAEWLARQITEAFPWNSAPKYLIRDIGEPVANAVHAREDKRRCCYISRISSRRWMMPLMRIKISQNQKG